MDLANFTFRYFENDGWYEERMKQCRFVITASVGILALLVLSPEKLPEGAANQNWWLYRGSVLATGLAAIGSTVYYLLCFRLRFMPKFVDELKKEKQPARFIQIYLRLVVIIRWIEIYGYWAFFLIMIFGFVAAMVFGSAFIINAVWARPVLSTAPGALVLG